MLSPLLRSLAVFAFFTLAHAQDQPDVCPRATGPGTDFDLQWCLDSQIVNGKSPIVIPPGRYRVTPHNHVHLAITDLHDVDIVATGVELVCTQTTTAIYMKNCSNVRIKGLAIDYDPLPFSEGKIVDMGPDKEWIEFQLCDGYPENHLDMRIEIYDPVTGLLRRSDPPYNGEIAKVGPGRYRIKAGDGYHYNANWDTQQVGDIIVCGNTYAPDGSWSDGVTMDDCRNVSWEGVWEFASNSNGIVEHRCDHIRYDHCHFDRRPLEADYPKRGFTRMRSLNAGGIHCFDDTHGPSITNCVFRHGGDDGVNLHGTYFMVASARGADLRVLATEPVNIQAGDPVAFLPLDGNFQPTAKAVAVSESGTATPDDLALVSKLWLTGWGRSQLGSGGRPTYTVTLDRAVNLQPGSLICAENRMGNGFVIKDSEFSDNRARGLLIKAGDGQIIGNKLSQNWLDAMLIAPEAYWMESGLGSNVVIANNIIDSCHATAIDVNALSISGQPLTSGAHANITILNNTVSHSRWPNIAVTSTSGLQISGNILVSDASRQGLPPSVPFETNVPYGVMFTTSESSGGSGSTNYSDSQIITINCADPVISDNKQQ